MLTALLTTLTADCACSTAGLRRHHLGRLYRRLPAAWACLAQTASEESKGSPGTGLACIEAVRELHSSGVPQLVQAVDTAAVMHLTDASKALVLAYCTTSQQTCLQAAEKLVLAEGTKMVMAALQSSYSQVCLLVTLLLTARSFLITEQCSLPGQP